MTREEAKTSSQLSRKDYRSEGSIEVWKALLEEELVRLVVCLDDPAKNRSDLPRDNPQVSVEGLGVKASATSDVKYSFHSAQDGEPIQDDGDLSLGEDNHFYKIDPHHFNAESDLLESLLNRDTSIVSSSNFDSLLEEFSGELAHIDLISPEIDEADFDLEEQILLVEKLLYDNSSPRPPEELNSKNSDAVI
ncbi:hypothetical protein Tco_0716260, partial [Tanacetum coccineum]